MGKLHSKIERQFRHKASKVELIRGGRSFFDTLDGLLLEAEYEIHLQVYILENDQTGVRIADALINAASRGVEVYVILDAYGSSALPKSFIQDLVRAGVHFKWFKPVIKLGNMEFGRRMHHKIVAVDESIALAGGINFANRYNDIENQPAWLDFALLVEGQPALQIKKRCLQIWESPLTALKKLKLFKSTKIESSIKVENIPVKVSVNDWLRGQSNIFSGYSRGFLHAEEEILLVGGYFLPGRHYRKRLKDAARRGVKVKVILTHISDVPMAKEATEFLYIWMFRNNIEIFEWKTTVLHGKVAVIDKVWSTVGSYNLNYLSTFESLELNLEVIDDHFNHAFSKLFHKIAQEECMLITEEDYLSKTHLGKKIKNMFSYWFARNSFRLLNAFSKKPKTN